MLVDCYFFFFFHLEQEIQEEMQGWVYVQSKKTILSFDGDV